MGIRQLVLLSAFLLTDGGISSKGKNWLIYFKNKDGEIIKQFQKILKQTIGKIGYLSNRPDGTKYIRIVDNKLAESLFCLSPSYRTKACGTFPKCQHLRQKMSSCLRFGTIRVNGTEYPKARIPPQVFGSEKLAKDFLKIYASCDGGVSAVPAKNKHGSLFLVRKVLISVKHPTLNDQLTRLFKKLGFNPYQLKDQIRLTKRTDIEKFKNQIAFIEKSKISDHSKYLSSIDKNSFLGMVTYSYVNTKPLLKFLIEKRPSSGLIWD